MGVLATTATDWATTATATDFTMARGRARLSLRLPLSPTTATMDWATMDLATRPTATAMDFTTARGRPRLTLTTTVDTTAMDSATATATVLATGPTTDQL